RQFFFVKFRSPPQSPLFPYTTLFRSKQRYLSVKSKGLIKIGRKIQGMSEIFFGKCGVTGIPIGIGCIKIIIGSRLGTDGGAIKLSCCAVVMLLQHRERVQFIQGRAADVNALQFVGYLGSFVRLITSHLEMMQVAQVSEVILLLIGGQESAEAAQITVVSGYVEKIQSNFPIQRLRG